MSQKCKDRYYINRQRQLKMKTNNFGLTEEEFNELVAQLKQGNESLFERIFLSQFEGAMKFLMIKYRASNEEAYDMCMDALIRFRKLLLADKIYFGNLKHLFNKISAQNFLKYKAKSKRMVFEEELPEVTIEPLELDESELAHLDKAWSRLGEECQYILKQYYYNGVKLYDIADLLDKSAAAIRKKKERCLNALRMNFHPLTQNLDR